MPDFSSGKPVLVTTLQPSQSFSADGREWWTCRKIRRSGDVVLVYCHGGPVRPFSVNDTVYVAPAPR